MHVVLLYSYYCFYYPPLAQTQSQTQIDIRPKAQIYFNVYVLPVSHHSLVWTPLASKCSPDCRPCCLSTT